MIYDGLSSISRYRGLYKGLDVLIDWLDSNDPAQLEMGKNEILGDKVFANVMQATTRESADAHYEVHHKYMDVQIDLEGREAFKVTPADIEFEKPFDEDGDFAVGMPAADTDAIEGNLDNARFALFAINEPHMPTLVFGEDGAQSIKKICFKLLADEYWD